MLAAFRHLLSRRGLRRGALIAAGLGVVLGLWGLRGVFVHRAAAQPASGSAPATPPIATSTGGTTPDYAQRVVAYIHNNQAITRQELGEYLLVRHGAARLPLLLNKRLLDKACASRDITVTIAEIDAALARDLKGLAVDQATFVKTVLGKYKKNLFEWKQDVLRPRLQLIALVKERISVTPEELRKAFEATYGEKVECRIILWPNGQERQAMDEYGKLRDETAFAEKAKKQTKSDLAATGGRIKPVGRYTLDPEVESAVFQLRPGQITTLIKTPEGWVVVKCDKRIPADTTVHFDSVKDKLSIDIQERKLQAEMAIAFQQMQKDANPQPLLKKTDRAETGPTPPPNQVVGWLYGNEPVTREELGEYLIARYGAEKLEFLVNRRIIDLECKANNIVVTEEDVDRGLEDDLKALGGVTRKIFEKELLVKWGKSLYEWREDVIRPKLMLTRLCQGRVRCTEEDLKKGYEAHYGERLRCRVILYPPDQAGFARNEYGTIRDSEQAFDRKAKSQPSASLASQGGKIPVFGRHTLGDEQMEREAFKLQPGEISALIGTPQGQVIIKCDERIPPNTKVTLAQVRDELTKEVLTKKVNLEMQVVFKDLYEKAKPRLLLKSARQAEDLSKVTKELMSGLPPLPGQAKPK
jgi:parvulin-like peptidyl-prolyl isomerase